MGQVRLGSGISSPCLTLETRPCSRPKLDITKNVLAQACQFGQLGWAGLTRHFFKLYKRFGIISTYHQALLIWVGFCPFNVLIQAHPYIYGGIVYIPRPSQKARRPDRAQPGTPNEHRAILGLQTPVKWVGPLDKRLEMF